MHLELKGFFVMIKAFFAGVDQLRAEMEQRDAADSTREASPLRPADDAVTIDTGSLSVAEVVGQILDLVGKP